MSINVKQVMVNTANGAEQCIGDFQGKVLLIVNVASKCGFTKQYEGLQFLQSKYGNQGFEVLAFPCNDFGGQEPGSLEEIKTFCEANYNTTIPLFAKEHAQGNTTEPFTTLNKTKPAGDVEWNFEKFLINKHGDVLARFKSAVEPDSDEIKTAIERAMKD